MAERATTLTETGKRTAGWVVKHAAIIALVLGLLCQFLPERYRLICNQIAHLCTGDSTQ